MKPHLVLNNSITVCKIMYATNMPYKLLFQDAHAVIFSVENKRLNFLVCHMYLDCVDAAKERKPSTVLNPCPANTCLVGSELIFL